MRRPPDTDEHNIGNVRGLMLAAVLRPESIRLITGCTADEARMFQEDAQSRMALLRRRVEAARAT